MRCASESPAHGLRGQYPYGTAGRFRDVACVHRCDDWRVKEARKRVWRLFVELRATCWCRRGGSAANRQLRNAGEHPHGFKDAELWLEHARRRCGPERRRWRAAFTQRQLVRPRPRPGHARARSRSLFVACRSLGFPAGLARGAVDGRGACVFVQAPGHGPTADDSAGRAEVNTLAVSRRQAIAPPPASSSRTPGAAA